MINEKIEALGLMIPDLPEPTASYIPAQVVGNLIFTSGQTPTIGDALVYKGVVGEELTIEEGYQAARLACINCLAEIKLVIGSLEKVKRIVKVNGFVRSSKGFDAQPKVINGASDLLQEIFGENGVHSRVSLGVNELPDGAAVEIEIIAEI